MDERRRLQRFRALKAGTISFNRAAGISCRVRNMSPAGACLEVTSQFGIPDNFVLAVSYDKFSRACHVIWRSDMRMGVTPEWNYVGAMTGRPYLSCGRDVLASRDIP